LILIGHKSGIVESIEADRINEIIRGAKTYTIIGGEFAVCRDDSYINFKTLLGSCVAMMFYDKKNGIKAMNHFLLPSSSIGGIDMKYGLYSVEAMLNEMYKMGSDKKDIDVKIAGGSNILQNGGSKIGEKNIAFAKEFCQSENFNIVSANVGGDYGKVVLLADSFKTFVKEIHNKNIEEKINRDEKTLEKVFSSKVSSSNVTTISGDIELF